MKSDNNHKNTTTELRNNREIRKLREKILPLISTITVDRCTHHTTLSPPPVCQENTRLANNYQSN